MKQSIINAKHLQVVVLLALLFPTFACAAGSSTPITDPRLLPPDQYFVGRILEISKGKVETSIGFTNQFFNYKIELIGGKDKGKLIEIEDDRFGTDIAQGPQIGDRVTVVAVWETDTQLRYSIDDKYRLPTIGWILALFLGLVIFFGRWRGIGSIVGLVASVLILMYYVVPQLLAGANPISTTLIGALLIAGSSILLAHGFNKRTYIALAATLITLFISVFLADLFVHAAQLFGMGSEESFYLQFSGTGSFDLQGLLLGGIIIGMLGILDDVTTAQSATVDEIRNANESFSPKELYKRGLSVGKEHIASLVNTLVLAYVGTSLPLFLLFTINQNQQPAWVLLNSEFIAEEIIRALAGSVALVLAVPISTWLAAHWSQIFRSKKSVKSERS